MNPHLNQPVLVRGAPLGDENPVVLAIHGRGASPESILQLCDYLDWPEATFVAPAAAGGVWYPSGFMDRIENNEPYLTYALAAFDARVQALQEQGVSRERLVLLGFSQGGCLTAEYAIRHPDRYRAILLFSGGVIGPPGTTWDTGGSFEGTPVFLGSSDRDAWIPLGRVHETAELYREMKADVTVRIYPGMPHTVSDEELADAREAVEITQGA
jgi:predicted esterase